MDYILASVAVGMTHSKRSAMSDRTEAKLPLKHWTVGVHSSGIGKKTGRIRCVGVVEVADEVKEGEPCSHTMVLQAVERVAKRYRKASH